MGKAGIVNIASFITMILLLISLSAKSQDMERMKRYVNFLDQPQPPAVNYIIDKFKSHDLIVICERLHTETTQYELFIEIARNEWFQQNVGQIFTEVGVANIYPRMHKLLFDTPALNETELWQSILSIVRDYDYTPMWEAWNYPNFIMELYKLNEQLPINRKIDLIPCDMPLDWYLVKSKEDYDEFYYGKYVNAVFTPAPDRDSVIFENIILHLESTPPPRTKKGLVILNYRHAFLKNTHYGPEKHEIHINTAKLLKDRYKNGLFSIWLNGIGYPNNSEKYEVLQNGIWDASFSIAEKDNVGFDLANSPFGRDSADITPFSTTIDKFTYRDLFDGFIFYKPISQQILVMGIDGFMDNEFQPEFIRRFNIFIESRKINTTYKEYETYMQEISTPVHMPRNDLEEAERKINALIDEYNK